jgi:magnesium transporter
MRWVFSRRITIDDIIDVIRDEADQDYQLAAGI